LAEGAVKAFTLAIGVSAFVASAGLPSFAAAQAIDRGCRERTLVATGGPFPDNPQTLAIRWTGFSNFELAYKGEVLLLDAYFERGALFPPLGFKAGDISRATGILIGHGHFDHMSDAASVALRTGAVVVGAPVTTEKLLAQNVDRSRVRTVTGKGGEELTIGRFKVRPILARHGEPPREVTAAFGQALQQTTPRPTTEQAAEAAAIRSRGTNDPRVIAEGTIAYLITLDNGFRVLYRDSGGVVTEFEKSTMTQVGRVDVALLATAASVLPALTAQQAVEYVRTYKPDVYMPAHHDGSVNELWRATEPLFEAIKNEDAGIITMSRVYREPACFDTTRRPRP